MKNKHVRGFSASFAIEEMQIKTTRGCHCTFIRMTKKLKKNVGIPNCNKDSGELNHLYFTSGNVKLCSHSGKKKLGDFFIKLNVQLPHEAEISLLGIYPREIKICIPKKTCTQMSTAVLFTII